MRALCEREGLEEVALHVDDGLSGGYRDRPGYLAWLDDARTGLAEVLVNYHTDRLTREGLNVAAQVLDTIEGKDPASGRQTHRPVRLLDCNGLDSNHGEAFRFRFVIQAEVGRAERERIRERNRNRARRIREAGRWPGGPVPYGYKAVDNPDGPGKVLVLEPTEAKHIREAADAILAGDNPTLVARRLNHAGVKPRRGKDWYRKVLIDVLTGDAVLGRVTVNGNVLRDEEGNMRTPFPPVLTIGQVAALRAKLAPKAETVRRGGRKPARLLSGLLTCHSCGSVLQVGRRSPRSQSGAAVVYRCPSRANGKGCDQPVAISAVPLEDHITEVYLSAVGHLPMYRERTVVTGVEELAAVEEDIRATLADLATSADTETFQRLQRLQARQKELSAIDPEKRTELIPTGQTMAEHWEGALTDDRRDLLGKAFDALIIGPGQRGRKGFDPGRLTRFWAEEPDAGEDLDEEYGLAAG